MKFLMMIKHAEQTPAFEPPASLQEAMGELVTEGLSKGWLKDTAGLKPTKHARRIRSKGGKLTTTDGPFTEAKEIVGGYAVYDLPSKQEAIAWTTRFMDLHKIHWPGWQGEAEIRQIFDAPPGSGM